MNLLLGIALLIDVPNVTAGPDLVDQAKVVDAPIAQVTVFSDRARVRRKAAPNLPAGIHTLRLPDLPGAVLLDTVRVEAGAGRVLRVEAVPVERERFSIDQVEKQLDRFEGLADRLALLDAERSVVSFELSLLSTISPRPPAPEKDRVGRPLPPILPETWRKVLDFLDQRQRKGQERLRALDTARRDLYEEWERARREVERFNLGAFSDHKVQVLIILERAEAGPAPLTLEYFVPGAAWWPAYDLDFLAEQGQVVLSTAGLVQQATGEDWTEVELELSTAIPGQPQDLPQLLTWTLGEKKEFIPRVVAARMPPPAQMFPPPSPGTTAGQAERVARMEVLHNRIQELASMAGRGPDQAAADRLGWVAEASQLSGEISGLGDADAGGYGAGSGYSAGVSTRGTATGYKAAEATREAKKIAPKPSPQPSRPPPPPPPPMSRPQKVRPQAMEMAPAAPAEVEMDREEYVAEPVAAEKVMATGSAVSGKGERAERVRRTALDLLEAPPADLRVLFADPTLPAVVAGGLDFVYLSPTRMTIPSGGERLRVPLSVERFPVQTFYEATPALKEVAYLKATVSNQGKKPILRGPVNIFVSGDFSGQGELATTGPGGVLALPLGADEDIRFKRKVVPATEVKGVFSKDEVTTYQVTIEVGNYKKRPVKVAVYDVLPKGGHEKIEIEKLSVSPVASKGPDADGVLRWDLDLPDGATRKIEFSYRITRPENWQLHQ